MTLLKMKHTANQKKGLHVSLYAALNRRQLQDRTEKFVEDIKNLKQVTIIRGRGLPMIICINVTPLLKSSS